MSDDIATIHKKAELYYDHIKPKDDSWKDTPLMAAYKDWDTIDKKGHWGDSFMSYPSKLFRDRYGLIDWNK